MIDIPILFASVFAAFAAGMVVAALLVGYKRDVFSNTMGEMDTPVDRRAPNEDTLLLTYVEANEMNIFFNSQFDGVGMWGILDHENKMLGAAPTLRTAVRFARDKGFQKAMDDLQGPVEAPVEASP